MILRETHPEPIHLGLGNCRLAILDLSPLGHQPMQHPDTGNSIVHNGEVYNFREVRAKPEVEGVRFATHSDTEVILKAYARCREGCLQEFRGIFAFAIGDAQRHRLWVARDPMGVKPLYFYQSDRHFLFASELRTLVGTGLIPRKLDQSALLNYLAFASVDEPDALISGTSALPPGHYPSRTPSTGLSAVPSRWPGEPIRTKAWLRHKRVNHSPNERTSACPPKTCPAGEPASPLFDCMVASNAHRMVRLAVAILPAE